MKPKSWTVLFGLVAVCWCALGLHAQERPREKVLRYAFPIAETGFDPQQLYDLYSRVVAANIFDGLYDYDYLARPVKVRPHVAAGMPVISGDSRTITVRIKPGIYFADDPVFEGKKRELTAQDFVYSYKRHYDPKVKSEKSEYNPTRA